MASVLEQVEVVGRLLSTLDGSELEAAGEVQSRALSASIAKIKVLPCEEKLAVSTAIAGLRLDEAAKSSLLVQVQGKCETTSRKRALQDFVSWPSFGTPLMWRDMAARPELSLELCCQHLNKLGLINPTKHTQRSIAAHVVTAEFAISPLPPSPEDAKRTFKAVGKRLKQLYKVEPFEYITKLPPSPAEMVRLHPTTAKAVFSRSNLPCACPLDHVRVAKAESMIQCRGDSLGDSTSDLQNVQQTAMHQTMMFMMQGFARMQHSQQSKELELQMFPSRSLGGQCWSSPGATRFRQLGDALQDAITPPNTKRPHTDSLDSYSQLDAGVDPAEARKPAGPAEAPKCLALLDAPPEEKPAAADKEKATAMRALIAASRAKLLADRAKAAADKVAADKSAAHSKGKKATAKAKSKEKAKAKACAKETPRRVAKPASWLKARPTGCAKCRYCPGCTKSCYLALGVKVPK